MPDACIRGYPVACTCSTCTRGGDTHNAHLRHLPCITGPEGHFGPHRFVQDNGTEVTVPTNHVIIGTVTTAYAKAYPVWAWADYGVVIPGSITTNGVVGDTARAINSMVEKGGTWEGPGIPGPTLATALAVRYHQVFPEAYARGVRFRSWDPRGPEFQWPETE